MNSSDLYRRFGFGNVNRPPLGTFFVPGLASSYEPNVAAGKEALWGVPLLPPNGSYGYPYE